MPYVKNKSYVNIPFSSETACVRADFYIYYDLVDLAKKCELLSETVTRCRTIGVLQSIHGKFYLTEMDTNTKNSDIKVRVSMIYLKSPMPSTVIPYPVQVFGTMQWKNRPVIYAKLIKVLDTSTALRMRETMNTIAKLHLAKNYNEGYIEDCDDSLFEDSFNISKFI
ncbi:uncharacterized protein LOC114357974 isoform X1 [Ostrinia furnacalis]|uniref:uncharacterized protein LOC114357974 isoform X1 n=1 Tax=Ostrinia furnacalis TaxID=93504 RepID=UPI00103CAB10|nr:uncharacterized protein LOC114357974 isoform X1 [Ostrinia furnacalis]